MKAAEDLYCDLHSLHEPVLEEIVRSWTDASMSKKLAKMLHPRMFVCIRKVVTHRLTARLHQLRSSVRAAVILLNCDKQSAVVELSVLAF